MGIREMSPLGTWLRRAGRIIGLMVAAWALAVPSAWALSSTDATSIIIGGVVSKDKCLFCHANIADTENYAGEIIFTHGYHIRMECSSCHTEFPHGQEGTERPTMRGCFACHGLLHGPSGELASGKCEDCHRTRRERLRPAFHKWDWAEKPHVKPGETQLQTRCMMCHDGKWCDDCHEEDFIDWKPKEAYIFDPGDGCLACHGNENLLKLSAGTMKSFQVSGVDRSAHAKVTCVQCHVDFKYEEGPDRTKLWTVNASLACQDCHEHKEVAAEYASSVHGQKLMQGDLESASCGSCHGGHYILRLDNAAAQAALHGAAYRVCARCHKEHYDSYDDYYHGAAYKRGALDAPACWDCHGAHDVLPSSDPSSTVSQQRMADTCGECHKGSAESFTLKAGDLIHKKAEARSSNPLLRLLAKVRSWVS